MIRQSVFAINFLVIFLLFAVPLLGQKMSIDYYLPEGTNYNPDIPTPESVLGYQVGEWHVSHDQLVMYMRELAVASDRIVLQEYARSHENRPLVVLIITSPDNHKNLEKIRQQHISLGDPDASTSLKVKDMPVVLFQGYSIHGNESSGSNAALMVAYYLAAAEGKEIEEWLKNSVFLLDPCMNPDGLNRFASWVNVHKSKNPVADPNNREHTEVWPYGRTNHYWFDLNRDWLLVQHPESQGRINVFHQWKPNILTDHHEMGTNSTFFFQPGIPSRTNPNTPPENQKITGLIADFHAAELDEIGSLYYSQESFDDFYVGKGSTYPDVNGCIGILFEQASSRGHLQKSDNGDLAFPFTIRNQVATSFSTIKAAQNLRTDLLDYQRRFYKDARNAARRDNEKAYVFVNEEDRSRLYHFMELLHRHQVEMYPLKKDISVNGQTFNAHQAYVVPLDQPQYRLIKAMFDTRTNFTDSLFYDVSSWVLPYAFNIKHGVLTGRQFTMADAGDKIDDLKLPHGTVIEKSDYGYLLHWDDYYTPKAVYQLLENELIVKVAAQPFNTQMGKKGTMNFDYGAILVPAQNQKISSDELHELLQKVAEKTNTAFYPVHSGLTREGIDLGSPNFKKLRLPKALIVGDYGVSTYDAGEVWHLLDNRFDMELSIVEKRRLNSMDLSGYNTIIMVNGNYSGINTGGVEKLKKWLMNGGVLITMKSASKWAADQGLSFVAFKNRKKGDKNGNEETHHLPYSSMNATEGAQVIGGAICNGKLDLSHPIGYGYNSADLPIFLRGTLFMKPSRNAYAMPLSYTSDPLRSGYISGKNQELLKDAASIIVSGMGKGRVISMADNPNFRAFWYGTNKLFLNAIFFGHTISGGATEKPKPGEKK